MEKIVVVGFGWVGQANALALARMGYQVFYYDIAPPVLRFSDKHSELYAKISPLKIFWRRTAEILGILFPSATGRWKTGRKT